MSNVSRDEQGYNGWTNHATWLVGLWLQNDQGTYEATRELLREHRDDTYPEDALKEFVTEMAEDRLEGFQLDLMGSALSGVNWKEVAESFSEDLG